MLQIFENWNRPQKFYEKCARLIIQLQILNQYIYRDYIIIDHALRKYLRL